MKLEKAEKEFHDNCIHIDEIEQGLKVVRRYGMLSDELDEQHHELSLRNNYLHKKIAIMQAKKSKAPLMRKGTQNE